MASTDAHGRAAPHTIRAEGVPHVGDWLTIGEAAEYMHLSISSLRRYDRQGTLRATRTPGKQRRYLRSQLDAWLASDHQAA